MDNNNYGAPVPGKGVSIAALVCGILGLVGGWIPVVNYFTGVLSIVAIVLGVKGRKESPAGQTGMATAGLVMGIVAVAITIIMIACVACAAAAVLGSGAFNY